MTKESLRIQRIRASLGAAQTTRHTAQTAHRAADAAYEAKVNAVLVDLRAARAEEAGSPGTWVSVRDALPTEDGRYLCATWFKMDRTQNLEICSFNAQSGQFSEHPTTHWQPLPDAPQLCEEEDPNEPQA